jgi:hypothetical protein
LCSKARRLSAASSLSTSAISRVGGAHQLHVEAGVEHVGGGHALDARSAPRPDDLGEMGEEGDDVVLDLALDRVDARDVEGGVLALVPDSWRRPSG